MKIDAESVGMFILGALLTLSFWGIGKGLQVQYKERVKCEEVLGGVYIEGKCLKTEEIPLENK